MGYPELFIAFPKTTSSIIICWGIRRGYDEVLFHVNKDSHTNISNELKSKDYMTAPSNKIFGLNLLWNCDTCAAVFCYITWLFNFNLLKKRIALYS